MWFGGVSVAVVAVIVASVMIFRQASHTAESAPPRAPEWVRLRVSPGPSSSDAAVTWQVASPIADLSEPLAGMPQVANPANIYADAGANMLSPAVRGVPYRIYVPNSGGSTVTVINPATYRVHQGPTRPGSTPSTWCPPTTCERCM